MGRTDTRTIRVDQDVVDLVIKEQARIRYETGQQVPASIALEVLLGMRDPRQLVRHDEWEAS